MPSFHLGDLAANSTHQSKDSYDLLSGVVPTLYSCIKNNKIASKTLLKVTNLKDGAW